MTTFQIPLREQPSADVSRRYVYVDEETNLVHLFVPVVRADGGISLDNTCQLNRMTRSFYNGSYDDGSSALRYLNAYRRDLVSDLACLPDGHPEKVLKADRLEQVERYIRLLPRQAQVHDAALGNRLGDTGSSHPITRLMLAERSNFYYIRLRPEFEDNYTHGVNPVFSVRRNADHRNSAFYNAMHAQFGSVAYTRPLPRTRLLQAVQAALPRTLVAVNNDDDLNEVKRVLSEKAQELFSITHDFSSLSGTELTKDYLDNYILCKDDATVVEYIDSLIRSCVENDLNTLALATASLTEPPFYSFNNNDERREKLSILTQFFMAQLNIYCVSHGLVDADQNFGAVLDNDATLSADLVQTVMNAFSENGEIETAICQFFNQSFLVEDGSLRRGNYFGLNRLLTEEDMTSIKETFRGQYNSIRGCEHFDDFYILDMHATTGNFVLHQNAIAVDFSAVVLQDATLSDEDRTYFVGLQEAFHRLPIRVMPSVNEHIPNRIDLSMNELLPLMHSPAFYNLPEEVREACENAPIFQTISTFLAHVGAGELDEAEALLRDNAADVQTILSTPGRFSDSAGRRFSNRTAYEYLYWALDESGCQRLAQHMTAETKAAMLSRVTAIELNGLRYDSLNNQALLSRHVDLQSLVNLLGEYAQHHFDESPSFMMEGTRRQIARAEQQLPAHILRDYHAIDGEFDIERIFDNLSVLTELQNMDVSNALGSGLLLSEEDNEDTISDVSRIDIEEAVHIEYDLPVDETEKVEPNVTKPETTDNQVPAETENTVFSDHVDDDNNLDDDSDDDNEVDDDHSDDVLEAEHDTSKALEEELPDPILEAAVRHPGLAKTILLGLAVAAVLTAIGTAALVMGCGLALEQPLVISSAYGVSIGVAAATHYFFKPRGHVPPDDGGETPVAVPGIA